MIYLKKHSFILLLVLFINTCWSQEVINSASVEQKTYQLFQEKNWTELITYGNLAISEGIDYYYLRVRIGIAYYEKKNYSLAVIHFIKALHYNSDDELTQEYIYYCYLFNGRYEDARVFSKQFSASLSEKIGTTKQQPISLIFIETGSKKTNQKDYYNEGSKSNTNYFKSPFYLQIGLNHYVKNKVSILHAVTVFDQKTFVNKVNQYQYYLKGTIPLKHNLLISPSVHFINVKVSNEFINTRIDTLWPIGVPPHTLPPPGAAPYKTVTTTNSITNSQRSTYFVGSLAVQKTIRKFVFGIGTSFSNMNNVNQFIHSGSVSYAPFGNPKLMLGCTAYIHTSDSYNTTYTSPLPFIYFQPTNQLSFKISYLYNKRNNIIEDNGYLINNSADLTKSRYSALLNYNINNRVAIYGLYQLEYKQENVQQFNYQYHVFMAGIKLFPTRK